MGTLLLINYTFPHLNKSFSLMQPLLWVFVLQYSSNYNWSTRVYSVIDFVSTHEQGNRRSNHWFDDYCADRVCVDLLLDDTEHWLAFAHLCHLLHYCSSTAQVMSLWLGVFQPDTVCLHLQYCYYQDSASSEGHFPAPTSIWISQMKENSFNGRKNYHNWTNYEIASDW